MAKPRRSRRTLTTLVVLLLLSVTVITLDESGAGHSVTSGLKSVAADVFSPFRSGVNDIIDPIGNVFAGAVHYGSLEQENRKLQAQIGALRQQAALTPVQQNQLRKLQRLLALQQLPATVQTLPKVLAQSIARGTSNFAATITINKGRSQGVAVTDPVVGSGGLVGQVVAASHSSATVRLITDGQSKVGVVYGNDEFATLDGQGSSRPLNAEFIASTAPVQTGATMVTNGLQGADFPANIPVATIRSVHSVTGATQKEVTATPMADLRTLAYVAVIQWSPSP